MALSTQRASASLPSSQSSPQWKHDVFLSFRGGDTRESFISHLYHELQYVRGIKTFKDDLELEEGKCISPSLLKAIEESRFAIVVLSPNYASSSWCLDELAKILESMEARETILPVFYHVDPSDVRYQKGSFAEAFTKHEEKSRQSAAKVKQWRVALTKVANLSGWDSKNYKCDRELIEGIVDFVWGQVHRKFRLLDPGREKLVGIDFRLEQLEIFLAPEENDVRFIGIWGMGGIGKTTLAKLVFDRFSHIFQVSSFLADVRSYSSTNDLVHLQKQLLSNVLKKQNTEVWNVMDGSNKLKNCLCNKQVLLILDNVDHIKQLDILAGNKDWFGMGSRIIITTRDQRLLVEHDIEILYKVEGLNGTEALQLFRQNAFSKSKGQSEEEGGFMELSKCFVNYAKGLPLALKILGCSLYQRGRDDWISALDMLMKSPDTEIFSSLKISYDGLCEMNKSVFLDVAFFHKGKEKEQVIEILDSCGLPGHIGINILIEKSLLTIEKTPISSNGVEMHDLIQEMAWEIVRRESYEEPGLRSRLCHRDDIFHVFMKNTGTEAVTGVRLRLTESEEADSDWNSDALAKMRRLRFIEFHNLIISSGPKVLPDTLRVIKWSSYPSKFLPPSFKPDALTELSLHRSKLVQLWNQRKYLGKLKYMDLSDSENLTSTPDFASTPNLEKLILEGCRNLVEIHPSFGVLKRLKVLQLMNCKSLKSLPSEVAMDSLQYFSLFGCSKVKKIPEFAGQMKNLSELLLNGTGIEKLPASIECLVGLHLLSLVDCKSLVCLPSAICNLKSLKSLSLMGCSKLDRLPKNLGEMEGLERLELEETTITELPPSLSIMKNLRKLSFRGSPKLWHWSELLCLFQRKSPNPMSLRLASLNGLCSLEELDLSDRNLCDGDIPNDIGCLSSLQLLDLSGNNFESLPPTIKLLSKLKIFKLERCKRLQQLPDLPSSRSLYVNASDCDFLKVLSDPSTPSRFTNLYEFSFLSVNCFRLVDHEGWNNAIFSLLRRLASQGLSPDFDRFYIVSPGSKIPEWFSNQIVGDSLVVELPLDSCSRWKGIAFCVVFADQEINTEALDQFSCYFRITCLSEGSYCANWVTGVGEVVRDHLWLFYMPSEKFRDTTSTSKRFSFETCRGSTLTTHSGLSEYTTTWMNVKKCGARLVYEQDLEQLTKGTLNVLKRAREYCDHDAAATGSGSGCFDKESLCKRHKEDI